MTVSSVVRVNFEFLNKFFTNTVEVEKGIKKCLEKGKQYQCSISSSISLHQNETG